MLNVDLPAGKYVVAVSGGVDSMVLLDVLRRKPELNLVVAHVNHGLRKDAKRDEKLVAHYAMSHNIRFVSTRLQLKGISEDEARKARFSFLLQCCKNFKAQAIVLAHHQDDVIETVLINLIRGTGWRGQAPFTATRGVLRPLLHLSKHQLIGYARRHNVPWHEDSTNTNEQYLRNHVRLTVMPRLDQVSDTWRNDFLQFIRKQQTLRRTIQLELAQLYKNVGHTQGDLTSINRNILIMLPPPLDAELLQHCFTSHIGHSLPRPQLVKVLLFAKVGRPHKKMPLNKQWQVRATKSQIVVEPVIPMVS